MKVNNIHQYKRAKQIVKDLNELNLIFSKFILDLKPYTKYTPVMDVYINLNDNYRWILLHLEDQKKIVESKGLEE